MPWLLSLAVEASELATVALICPLMDASASMSYAPAGGRTLTFNDNGGSADTITLSTGDVTGEGYEVGCKIVDF